jgi:GNAT superfamily N-acetyltransferase
MTLVIKCDLEGVNWERLAHVYAAAFHGFQTAALIETVFKNSYATRIAVLDGVIVGGVYAFSDGVLDATIHGLCVHPLNQRQGIGVALLKSLMGQFGPNVALLLTADETMQPIYRKCGFRPLTTAMALGFPEKDMLP